MRSNNISLNIKLYTLEELNPHLKSILEKLLKDTTYINMSLGVFSFGHFRDLPVLFWMKKLV
jgi:hypothetical protein